MKNINFKVGDVIDTKGHSNMISPVKIRKIEGYSIYFTDAKNTKFQGMARSTVRTWIIGGIWQFI